MNLTGFDVKNNVHYFSDYDPSFEKEYIAIREKENRVLTDEQVKLLPKTERDHPHYKEWMVRKPTLKRFTNYLEERQFETALDLGCGNGWFTNKVSEHVFGLTIGLDVNVVELEQAARVFHKENLLFCYGNVLDGVMGENNFDLITLNASVQYFEDLQQLIPTLWQALQPEGEIHILDSHFYKKKEVPAAKERSIKYYRELGHKTMADYYFHHSWEAIERFPIKVLYSQLRWSKLMLGKVESPFPWIRIIKK
jgi:ubiquinone/menaquinone biosynthesis C-methylase UbiE